MKQLSDNQISIMGRPNFACAGMAKLLIAAGIYEDKEKKAEYEQAVFMHWALGLLEAHGDGWAEEANRVLSSCAERLVTETAPENTPQPTTQEVSE